MENYDFKPNSFKYKEEQKKTSEEPKPVAAQKVVQGPVTIKKPTGIKRIFRMLLAEDLPKVKEYVLQDVLIPSAKKAIDDIVTNTSSILLYGSSGRNKKTTSPFGTKVSYYNDYTSYSKPGNTTTVKPVDRTGFDFDQYVFNNRGDAEAVLEQLFDMLSRYGLVRVSNFYEAIGEKSNNYCIYNYGWTNLNAAKVARVPSGYIIELPRPYALD